MLLDKRAGAAHNAALDLARQGRAGDAGLGSNQLPGGGTISERFFTRQTDRQTASPPRWNNADLAVTTMQILDADGRLMPVAKD
jgi:hypothetical protein